MTTTKQSLLDSVDWPTVMAAPRYAGGHADVMRSIWPQATVVAAYIQDDYQGTEAFAYEFPDGSVAILTDWFGSCSGCDSWEDAPDEEARRMVTALVTSARLFPSLTEAAEWCKTAGDDASDYPFRAARNLVFPVPAV